MATKKKRSSKAPNSGCLVVFALILIMVIVLAVKLPDILRTLEKTDFFSLVAGRKPGAALPAPPSPAAPPASSTPPSPQAIPGASSAPAAPRAPEAPASSQTQAVPQAPASSTRTGLLYFVKIEEDGLIASREVKRGIPSTDSPLTDSLGALLAGPNEGEIRAGLVSLIPRGTKILGVRLQGSTAVINLSEAFMYNQYGKEGYQAQLKQLVYTATAFPNVQDVQVLIEGQKKEYLGGEGVYVGSSLSRNSF